MTEHGKYQQVFFLSLLILHNDDDNDNYNSNTERR